MLKVSSILILFAPLLCSVDVFASPIEYQFDTGESALTGTFKYDSDTDVYSDIEITGIVGTYTYGPYDTYTPRNFRTVWSVYEYEYQEGAEAPNLLQIFFMGDEFPVQGFSYTGREMLGCDEFVCSAHAWEGTVSPVSTVPLPTAAWLFGSALLGLGVIKRKRG